MHFRFKISFVKLKYFKIQQLLLFFCVSRVVSLTLYVQAKQRWEALFGHKNYQGFRTRWELRVQSQTLSGLGSEVPPSAHRSFFGIEKQQQGQLHNPFNKAECVGHYSRAAAAAKKSGALPSSHAWTACLSPLVGSSISIRSLYCK